MRLRRAATVWFIGGVLAGAPGLTGCVSDRYPEGVLRGTAPAVAALSEQIDLGDALDAYYRWDEPESITAVLVPRGAVATGSAYPSLTVVRVMWRPKAAATPLARTATNAAVRHLVFAGEARGAGGATTNPSGESLGLFTGAGFVGLRGNPADGVLDLAVREADLRLTDCSAGYAHPLRRTALTARVKASRNDAAVSRWLKAGGVRASAALGYPVWVRGQTPSRPATAPGGVLTLHD